MIGTSMLMDIHVIRVPVVVLILVVVGLVLLYRRWLAHEIAATDEIRRRERLRILLRREDK
jgi:hypothetical protein